MLNGFVIICTDSNEPASDTALQYLADAEKEHHKKIIANIVQQIRPRVKELHELLVNPPPVSHHRQMNNENIDTWIPLINRYGVFCFLQKSDIKNTATVLSPPFGSTRLNICTLLSVLIETGNQDIIDA